MYMHVSIENKIEKQKVDCKARQSLFRKHKKKKGDRITSTRLSMGPYKKLK